MLRTFTWCVNAGATEETELKTNAVQFGDGYEQVSSFGINNAKRSWSVAKTARLSEIEAIYRFLLDHKGVAPFIINIGGETKTYRTEGAISKAHVGADVWQVSFSLKQVFVPTNLVADNNAAEEVRIQAMINAAVAAAVPIAVEDALRPIGLALDELIGGG